MEEWITMKELTAAHFAGLAKLDALTQAVVDLKQGRNEAALQVFDQILLFCSHDLQTHFGQEEQALFPALGQIIGRAGPIGAMLEEHASLWRSIDNFEEAVDELKQAGVNKQALLVTKIERVANHLIWQLGSHIQKEESMLFPLCEKTLDDRRKREVDENFRVLADRR